MRIALNFRTINPSKGGAETYVVDLARRLVEAGHAVTVFAESCQDGALPPGVAFHPVAAPGFFRWQQTWNFARNSEHALRAAEVTHDFDASLGLINTWHHDVLIPQGGVHGASLDYNARRFPNALRRGLYRLGKRINPKAWVYSAIEGRQYDPRRGAKRVVAVSRMVQGHLEQYHGVARERIRVIPNAIDAGRLSLDDPAGARAGLRAELGLADDATVALFVGHNYELKGLRPLLKGTAAPARPRPSRGADPPDRLRRGQAEGVPGAGPAARAGVGGPLSRLPARYPPLLPRGRLLRLANLL